MTRRILLIDDDPIIRAVAAASLGSAGWSVESAASGLEGITKAQATAPDAILVDMMMPELDGFATLQRLRASPLTHRVPVILLTASGGSEYDAEALTNLDVAAVVRKPFDIMRLPGEVASVLGWDR
ncbi:MAG: response regulator [Actinomycetota bacterium]